MRRLYHWLRWQLGTVRVRRRVRRSRRILRALSEKHRPEIDRLYADGPPKGSWVDTAETMWPHMDDYEAGGQP